MDTMDDLVVLEALVRDLGLQGAERYARKISCVPGGFYSAQYVRIAEELRVRIDAEFKHRLSLLQEVAHLPGFHPVEGDLGSVPI